MAAADFGGPTYPIFSRLVRVQTALWRAVDVQLRDHHHIALADVTALHVVSQADAVRVQDLAATLHITVGGASKVVDRLVASDLVKRAPHPTDRRSSVVTATPTGRGLLEQTSTLVADVLADQLRGVLDTSDVARLDAILLQLEASIDARVSAIVP